MVKLAGSGAGWMDLVWEKAVKYDAAVKWISRQVDADKSQWTVIQDNLTGVEIHRSRSHSPE